MSETTIGHESVEESVGGAMPSAASDEQLVAMLVDRARSEGLQLTGEGGLLQMLTKRVLESALEGEITDHLGYEKHDPVGKNNGNSRNGTRSKTVLTDVGPVEVKVPRDTAGSFEPQIVKKRQRRLTGVDEMVLSLSAKGLTHGEISAHLAEVYGAEVSKQTISTITDKVMDGMAEWQNRPLDRVYPVLFVDAINVKIRDGQVANRPVYVVMAVTVDGTRDILGIWAGDGGEGAKYWLHVFTELKNRGLDDVLMLVCDGLKGLPDAVETVWPRTIVQTCVVHLLRNSFRYAARQDWDKVAKALKPVYTAPNEDAAMERFGEFQDAWRLIHGVSPALLVEGEGGDGLDDEGEGAEGAAVAGGEDLPVFQVRDRSLDGGAELADALVVDLVSGGAFLARGFASRGEHAGADVAQIAHALPLGEGFGEVGLPPGVHVVAGARDGFGDREQVPAQCGGDLQVEAGVTVLAREHRGALARPVPGRDEGPVDQDDPAGRCLGRVGDVAGQDLGHHRQQRCPAPGDGGLADPEQLRCRLLDQVLPQQEQHEYHGLVQAQCPHPTRRHRCVRIVHEHPVDPHHQLVQLICLQPCRNVPAQRPCPGSVLTLSQASDYRAGPSWLIKEPEPHHLVNRAPGVKSIRRS